MKTVYCVFFCFIKFIFILKKSNYASFTCFPLHGSCFTRTTLMPNNINNNYVIGENITTANENKAPNECSSNLNQRVYEAINLATIHLASTRRDTIKLQNQVKELQVE